MEDTYKVISEIEEPVAFAAKADEDQLLSQISKEHREYLLNRHKTLDLVPLPSADPADTLNWPDWKKNAHLVVVAFHGMMTTSMGVGIVPAFEDFAKIYNVSLDEASYLGTASLVFMATAPLFWIPLADRFGRRPIWLLSIFCAGAFNVGSALVQNYASHMIMRILVSVFLSPGTALGQGVVVETFFAKQRAQKMGIWLLMVNVGAPLGPLAMGFVVEHIGWRWMYWIFAIVNLVQFLFYIVLGPETIYSGGRGCSLANYSDSAFKRQYLTFRRINPKPLGLRDFLEPLFLFKHLRLSTAIFAYAIAFNFVMVMLINQMSVIYSMKFHLSASDSGLNYLGILIGSLLGEFIGGPLSDYVVRYRARRTNGREAAAPEARLIVAHLGFPLVIVGVAVFLVQVDDATEWNLTPTVGTGVAAFGMEIVSTVLITYCSDSCPASESASIGATINFARLVWGFLGPFWYSSMLEACGLRGSAGLVSGLIIGFSMIPVLLLQVVPKGKSVETFEMNPMRSTSQLLK